MADGYMMSLWSSGSRSRAACVRTVSESFESTEAVSQGSPVAAHCTRPDRSQSGGPSVGGPFAYIAGLDEKCPWSIRAEELAEELIVVCPPTLGCQMSGK